MISLEKFETIGEICLGLLERMTNKPKAIDLIFIE
jgi:hypothetical protein